MTDAQARVRLTKAQRARADGGTFVRVDLPNAIVLPTGGVATSVLVGRAEGVVCAYANVCRHQAIPLDARGGTALGVMTDDGSALLCDSHGATYRPIDGVCIEGPCLGLALARFDVEEHGEVLVLTLRR